MPTNRVSAVIRRLPAVGSSVIALIAFGGCTTPHVVPVSKTGEPSYRNVEIMYELESRRELEDSHRLREIHQASAEQPEKEAAPSPDWSRAYLWIVYPHPEGHEGMAQARVRLSAEELPLDPVVPDWKERIWQRARRLAKGRNPFGDVVVRTIPQTPADAEIRTLDLSKYQLDLLLADLAGSGFFDDQQRPTGRARLHVRVDAGHDTKTWDPEPRLNDFVTRVYREGRLTGYTPPAANDEAASGWSF